MPQTSETPHIGGASRNSLDSFRDLDSHSATLVQARLASAPYCELVDDSLLPRWRDLGGLATLGDALALAGKVRRHRLTGSALHALAAAGGAP